MFPFPRPALSKTLDILFPSLDTRILSAPLSPSAILVRICAAEKSTRSVEASTSPAGRRRYSPPSRIYLCLPDRRRHRSRVPLPRSASPRPVGHSTSTSASTVVSGSTAATSQVTTSAVQTSSFGTTTTEVPKPQEPKLPSEISGKTVEEIIKDWNAELQKRTSKFRKQATAIAEWDRRILQNRNILIRLEAEVAKVVETQTSLERQLELIETHQEEVDKALQSMEEEAERIYKDERGLLLEDEAASARDAMYEQAEFIEREMQQMAEHIKSIIQTVNSNQGGNLDAIDAMTPIDVVVRILNNQLSSLMWIDEKANEFSTQIQKLANDGAAAERRNLSGSRHWLN